MIRLLQKLCGNRSQWGTLCSLGENHKGYVHSDDDGRIWN